jgi:RNA-directed DNA polymerase
VVRLRVAAKAPRAMEERVRQITSRNGGRGLKQVCRELGTYLRGGQPYVALAETPRILEGLDEWIHRRLRRVQLEQGKRGTTVFREPMARGGSWPIAFGAARHSRSWWSTARHGALRTALPMAHFLGLGTVRPGVPRPTR